MRNPLTLVAMLFALVTIGCSAVPDNHYYTMSYVLLPGQGRAESPYPATLRIRLLDIAPAYDMTRIVYRYSPYEFQYYNYMLWATKPQQMLTDMITRHLLHSNIFYDVASEYRERRPDYELTGMIHAIEELDAGDEWQAHLALTLRLSRYRDERVVWVHDVNVKKRVYNKEPVYVVRALSELMEEEMKKVVAKLDKFLRSAESVRKDGS